LKGLSHLPRDEVLISTNTHERSGVARCVPIWAQEFRREVQIVRSCGCENSNHHRVEDWRFSEPADLRSREPEPEHLRTREPENPLLFAVVFRLVGSHPETCPRSIQGEKAMRRDARTVRGRILFLAGLLLASYPLVADLPAFQGGKVAK